MAKQHADNHRLRQRYDDDVVERQAGIARLRPRPIAERLDDVAAEQRREMIALGENGEVDRHTEVADDIGDGVGVTVEHGNICGRRHNRLPDDRVAAPPGGPTARRCGGERGRGPCHDQCPAVHPICSSPVRRRPRPVHDSALFSPQARIGYGFCDEERRAPIGEASHARRSRVAATGQSLAYWRRHDPHTWRATCHRRKQPAQHRFQREAPLNSAIARPIAFWRGRRCALDANVSRRTGSTWVALVAARPCSVS